MFGSFLPIYWYSKIRILDESVILLWHTQTRIYRAFSGITSTWPSSMAMRGRKNHLYHVQNVENLHFENAVAKDFSLSLFSFYSSLLHQHKDVDVPQATPTLPPVGFSLAFPFRIGFCVYFPDAFLSRFVCMGESALDSSVYTDPLHMPFSFSLISTSNRFNRTLYMRVTEMESVGHTQKRK